MKKILNSTEIASLVDRLAEEIDSWYSDKQNTEFLNGESLLAVGILNGAFIFMADLIRKLTVPVQVEFLRTSSYGTAKQSSGTVRLVSEPVASPKGRHVLILDDLIDTGRTLAFAQDYFFNRGASDINIAVLLDKKKKRTDDVFCRFVGLQVEDLFLGGYGLDGGQFFSQSRDIFVSD